MYIAFTVILSSFVIIHAEEEPIQNPCEQPLKIGKSVNGSKTAGKLKYFYDGSLNMCLPYKTEGGDDGLNSFASEDDCNQCRPADFVTCGGNVNSTGSCGFAPGGESECPKGSICRNAGMVGMCCPEESESVKVQAKSVNIISVAYEKEYSPSCPKGSSLVTQKLFYGEDTFRGKSCTHNFCPAGSECHQGKWLAYCCRK